MRRIIYYFIENKLGGKYRSRLYKTLEKLEEREEEEGWVSYYQTCKNLQAYKQCSRTFLVKVANISDEKTALLQGRL